ncbi:glycosyl hydrolase family 18 protein [Desmospora profundinema]|uniref:chitinase n=1 Tax=Desmospora profundinema TaxID=1571184 RepID=A0ABU1IQW4_9BACL|nr:glycosyl hydrolase family 18 protein [Desmospora profundinema]MDR6227186.1 chitinase [Desmospora profundinema]
MADWFQSLRSQPRKTWFCLLMAFVLLIPLMGQSSASVAAAAEPPGKPALNHTHWNNDGNYKVEMNLWWGVNGTSWKLYENGRLIHTENLNENSPNPQYAFVQFRNKPSGTYQYRAELINSAGSTSSETISLRVNGGGGGEEDKEAPTAPANLRVASTTATSVSLRWEASKDNVGVTGYHVYRGDTEIATVQTPSFTDTGLNPDTSYTYTVKAFDAAGNVSAASNAVTARTQKEDSNGNSQHKIIAYYPGWATYDRNYQVTDIDASKVTHINYAFANIANGEIVVGDTYADTDKFFPGDCWEPGCKRGNFNQLNKLKQRHPHLKTLISVGGWTWSGNFSDAALTDASRTKFANSAVRFVREWGFDGVDLDWEYPVSGGLHPGRPEDKRNFTLLLQKVREKLNEAGRADGKQYLLTIASGAGPNYVQNTELDQVQRHLDWINIMTYDFHGSWEQMSGNNAPLFRDPADPFPQANTFNVQAAVQGHLNAGVPASKLIMGLPFYGRGWTGCGSANNGLYQNCSGPSQGTWEPGVLDYTDIKNNYVNKNGFTRYWNDAAKVPWLFNPQTGTFISYDDEESIGHKTRFIKEQRLAGAMFWELSADRNHELLAKVRRDLP